LEFWPWLGILSDFAALGLAVIGSLMDNDCLVNLPMVRVGPDLRSEVASLVRGGRFTPISGHSKGKAALPRWANCGRVTAIDFGGNGPILLQKSKNRRRQKST
jgi:hypothetical protein